VSAITRLRTLDARRLPRSGAPLTDPEADTLAEVLASEYATHAHEARAWCEERARVWRRARRGAP